MEHKFYVMIDKEDPMFQVWALYMEFKGARNLDVLRVLNGAVEDDRQL